MERPALAPEEVRICVAEDNRVNRLLIKKCLERSGYTNAHFFEDGKAAVEGIKRQAAEGEAYDVVLMDISMLVMDGMEATRLIRRDLDAAVRDVPIVAMYAPGVMHFERLQAMGVQDCLKKPFIVAAIVEMVEKYGNPPRPVVTEPDTANPAVESDATDGFSSFQPHL